MVSVGSQRRATEVRLRREFRLSPLGTRIAIFQPVTMYFKHVEEQLEEKQQWAAEEKRLLKALRDAVDLAFGKKKISVEQAEKYFQSSKFELEFSTRRTSIDF